MLSAAAEKDAMSPQRVAVLGATGSIGRNTLDVIARHPERYRAVALAAATSVEAMVTLCRAHRPEVAVMTDPSAAERLRVALQDLPDIEVQSGEAALVELAAASDVDTVMAAIVGFAGLRSTVAAARAGKRLLLANKESLVSAGRLVMTAVRDGDATLLPIDSEHNAMFQCLTVDDRARPQLDGVEKIVLTASGGPFRGRSRASLSAVTPDEACAHPNWSMGRKISVDSATLANKGLELAEACWLFDSKPGDIEVVVHPQSIVHSMIRYRDGTMLAQLGMPDMRTPIAYGLAWPQRIDAGVEPLDLMQVGRLDFEAPDLEAFPCLALAQQAIGVPGGMCVFNAANEVAVAAFLADSLGFTDIDRVIAATLEALSGSEPESISAVEELDARARAFANEQLRRMRG
jgi:1-deoxy-D-xylulose-5-phosphate reductoisomerase